MPPEPLALLVTNESVVRNLILLMQLLISSAGLLFDGLNLQTSARAARVNAYLSVLDIVQNETARSARKAVFETYKKKGAFVTRSSAERGPTNGWTAAEALQAEGVIQVYDQLGQFCRLKSIPIQWIVDSRYGSICHVWSACGDLIRHLRDERQTREAWKDAEWLCKVALARHPEVLVVEKDTGTVNSRYRDLPRLMNRERRAAWR